MKKNHWKSQKNCKTNLKIKTKNWGRIKMPQSTRRKKSNTNTHDSIGRSSESPLAISGREKQSPRSVCSVLVKFCGLTTWEMCARGRNIVGSATLKNSCGEFRLSSSGYLHVPILLIFSFVLTMKLKSPAIRSQLPRAIPTRCPWPVRCSATRCSPMRGSTGPFELAG